MPFPNFALSSLFIKYIHSNSSNIFLFWLNTCESCSTCSSVKLYKKLVSLYGVFSIGNLSIFSVSLTIKYYFSVLKAFSKNFFTSYWYFIFLYRIQYFLFFFFCKIFLLKIFKYLINNLYIFI